MFAHFKVSARGHAHAHRGHAHARSSVKNRAHLDLILPTPTAILPTPTYFTYYE